MPVVSSSYRPHIFLRSGHLQTVLPTLFRRVKELKYTRERLELRDGDFLDLDLSLVGSSMAVIIGHGLEGNTDRAYMRGMARACNRAGWDVVAWNQRGCSGEPNRLLRSYHSGETGDLDFVVSHIIPKYRQISLVGFSLGGNVVLKYAGERELHPSIVSVVAISAPCDLKSGAIRMEAWDDRLYMSRFLRMLGEKLKIKAAMFPGKVDMSEYEKIRTFREFDNRYTAPMHGFKDAEEYWKVCSSKSRLESIRVPTLMLSAEDDPILAPACFPGVEAQKNERLFLEVSSFGGHVGFMANGQAGDYYSEQRTVEFIQSALQLSEMA